MMPNTALMIATGSPLTNALGIAGSVGSQPVAQSLVAGWRAGPGARSQLAAAFGVGAAAGRAAGWRPAGADQVRA